MMMYGPTGVGKTTSILQTAPDPIMYIQTEPRSLKPSLDATGRPDLDIDVAVYEDWAGLIAFVANPKNFERYATVIVDSYSHLMSVGLSSEIEDQAFDARTEKEKAVKPLASQTKLSQEGYGALSSNHVPPHGRLGETLPSGEDRHRHRPAPGEPQVEP
jgi:hypothetical protein